MSTTAQRHKAGPARSWTVYRQGERMDEEISFEQISDVLKEPGTLVTLDLDRPRPGDLEQAREEFGLPTDAVADALHDPRQPVTHRHRPKLREYGETMVIILNRVRLSDGGDGDLKTGDLHLLIGSRYLICARHGAPDLGHAYDRAAANRRQLAAGPGFMLYTILDQVVDGYFPVLDELEERVGRLEEGIFDESAHHESATQYAGRVYHVKHDLIEFHRMVAPLREVLNVLSRRDTGLVSGCQDYFRDVNDHVVRVSEDLDAFRDLSTSALDSRLAMVTSEQSEITKKLAGWAAIIAVPTVIASIYGMNFENMPELKWNLGYPAALLLMALVSYGLYRYFHRKDWV